MVKYDYYHIFTYSRYLSILFSGYLKTMNYLKIFITLCFVLLVSCTVISYEEIEDETVGTTVSESSYLSGYMCEVEDSPYCEDSELKKLLEERSKPFLSGSATWYDYDLDIPN